MSAEVIPLDAGRTDPTPLANVESEAALLGALLLDVRLIDRVAEILAPDHFFEPLHGRIYAAILSEHAAGRQVNAITLKPYFADDPAMKQVGSSYLVQISGSGAALLAAPDFAEHILELAKRRALIGCFSEAVASAQNISKTIGDITDEVDAALSTALESQTTTRSRTFAQAFDETLHAIDEEAAGRGVQGIKIAGLADFDNLTGRMRPGELMYLGGRPSMGKTALAIRLASGAALSGHGTLFISLEMRVPELATRAISDLVFDAGFGNAPSFDSIRRGKLNADDRELIQQARTMISSAPLILTDPPTLSIGRLAMTIRRYRRQMESRGQKLELVIIDYLGLIKGSDRRAKRFEEVGEISRTLKMVAKECGVAMIVLAQLNRECERRDDKRPMLSDLRDAGDIEQDADQVLFVFREEYYLERSEPDVGDKKRADWEVAMGFARDRMEIIAAKLRSGRIGKRNCYFFGKHQAVRDHDYMRSGL